MIEAHHPFNAMRLLLLALVPALLAGCADDDSPTAAASGVSATSASRSYDRDDKDTFCSTVVTDEVVRDHFDIPASVRIEQYEGSISCSGYWGADSQYDDAATTYSFTFVIDRDEETAVTRFANTRAERTAAENQAQVSAALGDALDDDASEMEQDLADTLTDGLAANVGGTTTEALDGIGDEAVIVRVGGAVPTVAFRLGNVRITDVITYPNAWPQSDDFESYHAQVEERAAAFARAIAARM